MAEKGKGRTLINFIGIPAILALIWAGDVYFALFIGIAVLLAMNDFYNLYAGKGYFPSKILGMGGGILVLIFYNFNLEISSPELIGSILVFTFLTWLVLNELPDTRTIISMVLAIIIILIQLSHIIIK